MKYFSILFIAVVLLSSCTATKPSFDRAFSPVFGEVETIYQATYRFDEEKARPPSSTKPKDIDVIEMEEDIVEEEETYVEVEVEQAVERVEEVEADETDEPIVEVEPVAEVEDVQPTQSKEDELIDRLARERMAQLQREQRKLRRAAAEKDKKAAIKKRVKEDFSGYEKVLSISDSVVYFHNESGIIYKNCFYCTYGVDGFTETLNKCYENNTLFDKKDKILSFQGISFYSENPDTVNQIAITYDDETNLPLLMEKRRPNGELIGRLEYIYDDNNQVKQQIVHDFNGRSSKKEVKKAVMTFERNQQGWFNKVTRQIDGEDELQTYEYEFVAFDEKGNWTKMIVYNPYFDYPEVVYRKIVYR